jgi:hypothetical protein
MKIHPVGAELFHAEGQKHMTKLIVTFRILRTHKKRSGCLIKSHGNGRCLWQKISNCFGKSVYTAHHHSVAVYTAHHQSPCYFKLHAIKLCSNSGLHWLLCVQAPEYKHILITVLIQLLYSLHNCNKNCKRWILQVRYSLMKWVPADVVVNLHPKTMNGSKSSK